MQKCTSLDYTVTLRYYLRFADDCLFLAPSRHELEERHLVKEIHATAKSLVTGPSPRSMTSYIPRLIFSMTPALASRTTAVQLPWPA
jgi:hypothetical protein